MWHFVVALVLNALDDNAVFAKYRLTKLLVFGVLVPHSDFHVSLEFDLLLEKHFCGVYLHPLRVSTFDPSLRSDGFRSRLVADADLDLSVEPIG